MPAFIPLDVCKFHIILLVCARVGMCTGVPIKKYWYCWLKGNIQASSLILMSNPTITNHCLQPHNYHDKPVCEFTWKGRRKGFCREADFINKLVLQTRERKIYKLPGWCFLLKKNGV